MFNRKFTLIKIWEFKFAHLIFFSLRSRSKAASGFSWKYKNWAYLLPRNLFRLSESRKFFSEISSVAKNGSPRRNSSEGFLATLYMYIYGSKFFVKKRLQLSHEGMTKPVFLIFIFKKSVRIFFLKSAFLESFPWGFLKMKI